MKKFVEYDEEADTLVLRKANEDVLECINDRDICILELNNKKQIVGLEFLDVRKTFNIPVNVLKEIKDSRIQIRYDHSSKLLYVNIVLIYRKEQEKIAIPISADLGKKDFISCDFKLACASS